MRQLSLAAGFAALLAVSCGGGSGGGSSDPRCTSLCTIEEPPIAGAGDVCSQASADACLQLCGAQIEGTTAACTDCLLQDSHFPSGESGSSGGSCDISSMSMCASGTECTMDGRTGQCTYCQGDTAQEQACEVQTNPRREVSCSTEFRDPTKCSSLCAAQ